MCAIFGWWKPELPVGFRKDYLLVHLARKCQTYEIGRAHV
jgi:hypothetical protein